MYILYLYIDIYIYIFICLGMSVAVGPVWPSLFHGSEGKKTNTTNNQPAGHILQALTFAFPAVGITTSMVAVCCMPFAQAGRAFSQVCSNMHPASYCIMDFSPTDVRSTLAAKPAQKSMVGGVSLMENFKEFHPEKNILKWPNSLSKSSGRGDKTTNTTG